MPQSNGSPIISLTNVSWQAGPRVILNNISCDITPGSFTGILGPNGAGKSTLLRLIYRFLAPSKGTVTYQGADIQRFDAKDYAQKVAVVLQHTPQDFQLSVVDVVALGLVPYKNWLSPFSKHDQQLVLDALSQVGLADKTQDNFETLSGGEKQRVMIARAIVQRPEVLVMDEPTSHLDVKYQIQIMELAKSLGITVIASFHDLNLAAAICDKLLLLNSGELVAAGKPSEVITESTLSEVFDVCTKVSSHPQHHAPQVTYYYGYATGVEKGQRHE